MAYTPDVEKSLPVERRSSPHGDTSDPESDDTVIEPKDESELPEGGLVAWSQVVAGILTNMLSWGYPTAFGVYQLQYVDTLKLPESQIAWIGSIQVFLANAMCAVSGRMADAGYVRSTVALGAFLAVLGTFMTSIATEYWQIFLAQGVCTGMGLGIESMPVVSVISSYFKRKRSFALAAAATGTGIGAVIFAATIQYLIPRVGFPWAVRCSGFVALVTSILNIILMKPRLKPRKSGPLVEWGAFKEQTFSLFALGSFLFFWALYLGFFYINAYARDFAGFSTTDSVQLILIMNAMSVPARPLYGAVADYVLGPINTFTMNVFILGCLVFAWIGVTSKTGMYIFTVFFGFANGAAQGVFIGSLTSLTGDPQKMGTRTGMVCTINAFATLAGPPTAGAIIDATPGGRYLYAQIWAGAVIFIATGILVWARCMSSGLKLKVKI